MSNFSGLNGTSVIRPLCFPKNHHRHHRHHLRWHFDRQSTKGPPGTHQNEQKSHTLKLSGSQNTVFIFVVWIFGGCSYVSEWTLNGYTWPVQAAEVAVCLKLGAKCVRVASRVFRGCGVWLFMFFHTEFCSQRTIANIVGDQIYNSWITLITSYFANGRPTTWWTCFLCPKQILYWCVW